MAPRRITLDQLSPDAYADLLRVASGEMPVQGNDSFTGKHGMAPQTARRLRDEILAKGESVHDALPSPGVQAAAEGVIAEDFLDQITFDNQVWTALEQMQDAIHAVRPEGKKEISLTVPDDEPILVVWQSDMHLGHTETMYRKLRQDCETVRNTDGMYVILGGDLIDNVVTGVASRGMHHQQITNVDIQKYLAEELTEYLGPDNVLTMLLGNHDEWSMKSDDFNPIAYLCKHIGCPYLGPWGTVGVTVGEQDYSILCSHQFRMRSSFNLTHSAKRFWDFMGTTDHDAVMMGHTHEAAAETAPKQQKYRFFGQAGSYLRTSLYGQRLGFADSQPIMPGVLLWPDEHDCIGVPDAFRYGPWLLQAARADYRKGKKSMVRAARAVA